MRERRARRRRSRRAALTLERERGFDVDGQPDRRPTRFYEREQLIAGNRIEGPAVINQYDTTTVVPPGLVAEIDGFGNIVIDCSARGRARASAAASSPRRS